MANGFYLMHRGWMDSPFFSRQVYCERMAWIWLIENAVWQNEGVTVSVGGNPTKIERGKLSYSIRYLAEAWGWKPAKIQRFLKSLKKWNMVDTQTDTGMTVITICNYERYQLVQNTDRYTDEKKSIQERYRSDTNKNELNEVKELMNKSSSSARENPDQKPTTKGKDNGKRLQQYNTSGDLPPDWVAYPEQTHGWTIAECEHVHRAFWRYWTGPDAKNPVKRDWARAWQNWCDRANGRGDHRVHTPARANARGGTAGYLETVAALVESDRTHAWRREDGGNQDFGLGGVPHNGKGCEFLADAIVGPLSKT